LGFDPFSEVEGNTDLDKDGKPNYQDDDSDGNGPPTSSKG
jgi:hypothetical protein